MMAKTGSGAYHTCASSYQINSNCWCCLCAGAASATCEQKHSQREELGLVLRTTCQTIAPSFLEGHIVSNHSKTATAAATSTYKAHTLASTHAALPAITTSVFDHLPDSALVRESQLVQSPKRPHGTAPLPFSAATLWRMSRAGTFPKPVRLSAKVTAWRVGDVRSWLATQAAA